MTFRKIKFPDHTHVIFSDEKTDTFQQSAEFCAEYYFGFMTEN